MILQRFLWEGSLTYIVGCEKTLLAAIIDPTEQVEAYADFLKEKGLKLAYIFDTHSHADHISSAKQIAELFKAPVCMSSQVREQRKLSEGKGIDLGIDQILKENSQIEVGGFLVDGQEIQLGELKFEIITTPGHTKDSLCLKVKGRMFTGDTLLIGQCGRTDLPGGNSQELYQSIFQKILPLGDEMIIYPGHDYKNNINTVLGYEQVNNPFLQLRSQDEFVQFVGKFFPPLKVDGGGALHCGVVNPNESLKQESSTASPLMNQMCIAMENYFVNVPNDWNTISPEELKKKIDGGDEMLLLDVREPSEFVEGHIKNAVNISVRQIVTRIKELPDNHNLSIITICRSGVRAASATLFLRGYGYGNVKSLEYGMLGWANKGYPIERGAK